MTGAGAAATGVDVSFWLLAFSIFFFLSLALVKRYVELRDYMAKKQDEFDTAMGPYRISMDAIQNEIHARLNADGLDNIKTPFGTAYKSNVLSVKVADRQTFFDYIFGSIVTSVVGG